MWKLEDKKRKPIESLKCSFHLKDSSALEEERQQKQFHGDLFPSAPKDCLCVFRVEGKLAIKQPHRLTQRQRAREREWERAVETERERQREREEVGRKRECVQWSMLSWGRKETFKSDALLTLFKHTYTNTQHTRHSQSQMSG